MDGQKKRERHAMRNAILRGCYRRGWDDALIGSHRNPYTRSDNALYWQDGHDKCLAGRKPPDWLVKPQWVIDAEKPVSTQE